RTSPRNLRSLYFGSTSDEENGWSIRPRKPLFFKVVVVIGVGVGAAGARIEEVASGVGDGAVSSARSRAPAARKMEKRMAGRIIDGLQDEKVAVSIGHEIHFRESDCGTFGHFRHR